ncbi:SCO family protein [Stieleria sp. TO1_6]|uniref:SCO family protein n=1 Tax=Stieleria tagensis TaxID=2956795 RepID=UPI00209B4DD5|nr:SCO family protein [Stieleria tagensis]MCO8120317.1 SCO family protein [Stieleria tagensis]
MRTATNLIAILAVGAVLGLIGRSIRSIPEPAGPGPDDIVHTPDVAPGEKPLVDASQIANDEVAHPPEDEAWLSRFELTERSGKLVNSEDLLGAPYVVSFFFTRCPSICVQQNQKLKELQDKFAGQAVKFIAISVDPENDTPQRMREYAARFGADEDQWLFLTGDLLYTRRIGAEIFQQPVDKQFHTEKFALVDVDGKIEGFYEWPNEKQFKKLEEAIEKQLGDH